MEALSSQSSAISSQQEKRVRRSFLVIADGRLLTADCFLLAFRTVVRGPPREADARDWRATARARLAGPAVDAELLLVAAALARAADVIADGRTAERNGPLQHLDHRPPKPLGLGGG